MRRATPLHARTFIPRDEPQIGAHTKERGQRATTDAPKDECRHQGSLHEDSSAPDGGIIASCMGTMFVVEIEAFDYGLIAELVSSEAELLDDSEVSLAMWDEIWARWLV